MSPTQPSPSTEDEQPVLSQTLGQSPGLGSAPVETGHRVSLFDGVVRNL